MGNRSENRSSLRFSMKNKQQVIRPALPPRNSKTSPDTASSNEELRRLSASLASEMGYSNSFVKAQARALRSEREYGRNRRTCSSLKDPPTRGIRTSASPYLRCRLDNRASSLRTERRSNPKSRVRFSEIIQPSSGDNLCLEDPKVCPKQVIACTQTDPVLIIQPVSLNEILKKHSEDADETSDVESKSSCVSNKRLRIDVKDDLEEAGKDPPRTPKTPIKDSARTPRSPENDCSKGTEDDASKKIINEDPRKEANEGPKIMANEAPLKLRCESPMKSGNGHPRNPLDRVPIQISPLTNDKKGVKDLPGIKIDPDKIILRCVIGKGGFGTVYKAMYDGEEVAVKLLKSGDHGVKSTSEIESIGALYKQEAALWEKLDHPNITKFIGSVIGTVKLKLIPENTDPNVQNDPEFVVSEVGCIIEEYLTGGNVRELLHKYEHTKLDFNVVMNLVLDLARGLSYIHSQAVVHRDIKTDNLLLDDHLNLKIADFGVSRLEAQNPSDMTGETGTRGYMAPEVSQGKPYNHKCDVYSFGICLWEMYCGESAQSNRTKGVFARKNSMPSIPKCCPQNYVNIMKKCWSKNPEDRPEMHDVVTMLEGIDIRKGKKMQGSNGKGCFCFSM